MSCSAHEGHRDIATRFQKGDYGTVALKGPEDAWETHAARVLIGASHRADLSRFQGTLPRFYEAVGLWIEGDESAASQALQKLDLPHAQNLLRLLGRPKIRVLAQCDRGSQWDVITSIQRDPRFEVVNVGFSPKDKANGPHADVRSFYDPKSPPDFYVAKMLEWHLLPPNLQELPCPTFGHTADYDLHIQTVQPWLDAFDELLTTDHTEWRDVSRFASVPVSVFPKAFGLTPNLPVIPPSTRPLDLFISGTTQHPYHPDKAQLIHQVLRRKDLQIRFLEGFLALPDYFKILSGTRATFTYIRHAGGMPTRGLEALAMGAAIAVQEESILRAYIGEEEGVLPYSVEAGNLPDVLSRITRDWGDFSSRAARGSEWIRREFSAERTAGQYFRFLTFLAAKPRPARVGVDATRLQQRRSVFFKGWTLRPSVNKSLRQKSLSLGRVELASAPSPESLINMSRELVLEYASAAYPPAAQAHLANFGTRLAPDPSVLATATGIYRAGVERFPKSLVLRFNWIRTALHFGQPAEVRSALVLAGETVQAPTGGWQVSASEDVFPWDFFGQFFNYRSYFDECTRYWQSRDPECLEHLVRLILGSLSYYLSCYSDESRRTAVPMPGARGNALQATRWDPEFPFYRMRAARLLLEAGTPEQDAEAVAHLLALSDTSMLHIQAADLLESMRAAGRASQPGVQEQIERAALTRSRMNRTVVGREDWETLPLRSVGGVTPVSVATQPSVTSSPSRRLRVLYLCLEFAQWHHARKLAYPAGLGLEEGFHANNVDVVTIPAVCGLSSEARAAWQAQARELVQGQAFDQVWVELVHSEWDAEFWKWLPTVAPVRVGLLMESLRYEPEVCATAPNLRGRRAHVEPRLNAVTHVLCIDEADVDELRERGGVEAVWWPQTVPGRFLQSPPPPSPDRRSLFSGSVYGTRESWLRQPGLSGLLTSHGSSAEDATPYPEWFDEAHRCFDATLAGGGSITPALLQTHLEAWRRIRTECFRLWLEGLQGGAAVVNLPSFVRSYAGRVFEAVAAGVPAVSWEIPGRPRTRALFEAGSEILLFQPDAPQSLIDALQELAAKPERAREIAEKATLRVRNCHTVERRVHQVLEWIARGVEPDYQNAAVDPIAFTGGPAFQDRPFDLPECAAPLLGVLGQLRARQGDLHGASHCLAAATALRPADPALRSVQAEIAAASEDLPAIKQSLQALLHADAGAPRTLALFADVCRAWGHRDLARQAVDRISSRGFEDFGVLVSWVRTVAMPVADDMSPSPRVGDHGWLANLIQTCRGGDPSAVDAAREDVRREVAEVGNLVAARAAVSRGEWSVGWSLAFDAIRLRPFHPEAWLLLADAAAGTGDAHLSRECIERARKLAPRWKRVKDAGALHGKGKVPQSAGSGLEVPAWVPKPGDQPRLTVCFIVKNEERFIARSVGSVRSLAFQVVVVDTGSSDRTAEIARELGAEVHSFAWRDDFAAARNACLMHARGDWVLLLDADEELPESSHPRLIEAMANEKVIAWRLPLTDVGKENEGSHHVPRLFRNVPGAFFQGRIHEHAYGSLERFQHEWGLENRIGRALILHHGYTDQLVKSRSKVNRNLRLLELALEEQPDDVSLRMSYGLDLVRSGQMDSGLDEYARALKLLSLQPSDRVPAELRERLLTLMTSHLMTAQRFQSVVDVSRTGPARDSGPTASLHLLFGLAYFTQGQHAEAATHFRQCIAKRGQSCLSPILPDTRTGVPRHLLAMCHRELKQPRDALKEFRSCILEDPKATAARFDFARFLEECGESVPALEQLHAIITQDPGDLKAWRLGCEIALKQPDFLEFAGDWTAEASGHFPRDPVLMASRAEVLLLSGHEADSEKLWARLPWAVDSRAHAALILCQVLRGRDCVPPAAECESAVSRDYCAWFRRLVEWQAESSVRRLAEGLDRLEAVLPTACEALRAVLTEAEAA